MIYDTIQNDIKKCMKDENLKWSVTPLRSLVSRIKNETVNAGKEITDEIVLKCINKELKEIHQSIESFLSANRDVKNLTQTLALLESYLPPQLSIDDIEKLVKEKIQATGYNSKKQMGLLMKELKPITNGKCDCKLLSDIVIKNLS